MTTGATRETWGSRMGVIMAVAGSAVGLGNFLRFPGLAARYGSGAFMIAYFISLLILGIPICWAEWTLGRYAGQRGFRSSPGIFYALIRHPVGKYIGVLGAVIPVTIYMYYVFIESWCLGYSWYSLSGRLNLGGDVSAYGDFWASFVGATQDGLTIGHGHNQVLLFLLFVFALNFVIIYRGIAKGIETFCRWGMPALIVLALIVLVRVLTLGTPDPARPDQNLLNGLGFMWNPDKAGGVSLLSQLADPQLWLAAAGQIFFSLSVGFGVIITYASYLSEKDDIVLSGLTASSANEFCEVALGGMITVPAAFVFLGAAGVVGQGTFELGFKVLPLVFSQMPAPWFFGGAWFFLLFLAAVTSSLSMLQPGIAFLEEGLGLNRKQSVSLLGLLTAMGCLFIVYFSRDLKALDTIDFWVGTFLIFVLATVLIIVFGWVVGIEKGWQEAHKGAAMRIPAFFKPIIKYVCPLYLLTIFSFWILLNVLGWNPSTGEFRPTGYVKDLLGDRQEQRIENGRSRDGSISFAVKPPDEAETALVQFQGKRTGDTLEMQMTREGEQDKAIPLSFTRASGRDGLEGAWSGTYTNEADEHLAVELHLAENESLVSGMMGVTILPNPIARTSVGVIAVVIAFFLITTSAAGRRWDRTNARSGSNAGKETES